MDLVLSFILSVAAGVVSNCISKWLDGKHKDSKHSQMEEPPWSCNSEGVLSFWLYSLDMVSYRSHFYYMRFCKKVKPWQYFSISSLRPPPAGRSSGG